MKFERPPKIWIAWAALVVTLIVLGLLGIPGCATAETYRGPVAKEAIVSLDQKRHFVTEDPRSPAVVKTQSVLKITNPSVDSMTVTVECEGKPMTSPTYMTLDIAARTTQRLLLLPEDGSCVVKQW